MNKPTRKPVPIAEATQELPAVLGAIAGDPRVATILDHPPGTRKAPIVPSSIAPVGLDLARGADLDAEDASDSSVAFPVKARRQRLGKIVVAAVGACAVILVAAGIARIGHASSEPAALASESTPQAPAANNPGEPAKAPAAAPVETATAPSSDGTIRLDHPATPGHVWLDGKKMAESSMVVSCGTHTIRVGRGRKHSVDVPCGGEVSISK